MAFTLKCLKIKNYKNIKSIELNLSEHKGLTLLIGNNGSGKSNLLESISDIFFNLYQNATNFKTNFFHIIYENDSNTYSLKYENGVLEKNVNNNLETTTSPLILPKRLVAVYSGETIRLWDVFYKPIYERFVQNLNDHNSSASLHLPEMIYLDRFYWNLSLLSLLCSEAEDIKSFCRDEIGIKEKIFFEFKYAGKYHDYTNSRILEFVKTFDAKNRYTRDDFIKCIYDKEFVENDIFELLYCAYQREGKIITDIKVIFNDGITVDDLSEGIKKRILIRAALEFAGQENSLYLLDEPDAHVHLSKKGKIIEDIIQYKDKKHIIITSHSPTMCKNVGKENPNSIVMLDEGENKTIKNFFEAGKLLSDDSEIFNLLFTTKHIVLTEGKTDCQYIRKALSLFKDKYPDLYNNVDFISVGGTDGDIINDFLPRITDLTGRKIIVLVDRDDGGLNCARTVLNNKKLSKNDIDIKSIDNKPNGYFVMIPSIDGTQENFMIEDYFKHSKIQQLSIKHIKDQFKEKNFSGFPRVKDDLKKKILPNFCDKSTNPNDFKGFKLLLDKLTTCLKM